MTGPSFLDAGLLNKRAALEVNEPVPDGMGGASDAWAEIAEVSIRVEPLAHDARQRFDQRVATLTHRVTMRHREGLDRGMAFRLGQRRLLVRSVHDPDETRRFLVCRCEEER